ncbi:MAG: ral stress protein CsbD [Bryobacterales bacterium]|nr:ral stress protein CsbD [Bryobacterales bacterium]
MNDDVLEGNWKQFKGNILEQWGKLTDDDLDVAAGRRDQLAGKLQERYGLAKDAAESQIEEFEARFRETTTTTAAPVCPICGIIHPQGTRCPTL